MSDATIHVRFSQPGWHLWPGATGRRHYLASLHRHLFSVQVDMGVTHDDREVEFHDLRDEAIDLFSGLGTDGNMGAMSCEHMARAIGGALAERYARTVTVSVWEDNEFGATVQVAP